MTIETINENTIRYNGEIYDRRAKGEAAWEPEEHDDVWVLGLDGTFSDRTYYGNVVDEALHARNRIFRTREEAEQDKLTGMDAKLVAQTKINRFCEAEGIENKFVNEDENWSPYHSWAERCMKVSCSYTVQVSNIFNVRTESDANKIIAACGKEIEILLGVK